MKNSKNNFVKFNLTSITSGTYENSELRIAEPCAENLYTASLLLGDWMKTVI